MKHERYYWGEWLGDFYLLESEKNTLLENCHSHVKKKSLRIKIAYQAEVDTATLREE